MSDFLAALKRVLLTWTLNLLNLMVFTVTYGHYTFTEGRFYAFVHKWANWNLYFSCQPREFIQPEEEQEIKDYIKRTKGKVRVVGGGHSFNPGTLSDDLLISLDKYNKVVKFDEKNGIITVQAGLRLRDLITIMEDKGWDLPVMGTTNVQSIGGLVASDLHATGKDYGFLSQQIEAIKIINGNGEAEVFTQNSDVFKSALGGIGAMGVVVEVTLQLVKKFLVRRTTNYVNRFEAEAALDTLLEKHDHVGFFYIGGLHAKKIRLTTYDYALPHENKPDTFYYFKNFCAQIFDLLNGGFFLDFIKFFPPFLNVGYFVWNNTFLGSPFIGWAGPTFTSKLFFRHDEMEYGMPRNNFKNAIDQLMKYLDQTGTVALMEVRFTVKNAHTKALLGPGTDRETCFIEILPCLTHDTRKIYAATEGIFESNDGRPHLGKFTTYRKRDMVRHYNAGDVQRWLDARERQDPDLKFVNGFVHQIFFNNKPSSPLHQEY
eukprot:Phypoly_transcript_07820.p1 GENE.Phypoly_transcript_07820~~Phypoly_transcript_07820.p1  ORF type:complete len:487 (+),score=78.36 Phypoly_transcript_07820:101-1561(+)